MAVAILLAVSHVKESHRARDNSVKDRYAGSTNCRKATQGPSPMRIFERGLRVSQFYFSIRFTRNCIVGGRRHAREKLDGQNLA